MTSTPRLDSLTAAGTNHEGIRLADGHMLTLDTRPGADVAHGVFLFPGLDAPDTDAWENEDHLDSWLTGGSFDDGPLYIDVPVEAIRDLIIQHGGEHPNQEPAPAPQAGNAPKAAAEAPQDPQSTDVLADTAYLRGRLPHGYSAKDVQKVFSRLYDAGGPYLVCVWEYADENGFGGTSQFYAEDDEGDLFELQPEVRRWLSGQQETPGPVNTWVGAPVEEPTDFPVSDDSHNYARTDRTE